MKLVRLTAVISLVIILPIDHKPAIAGRVFSLKDNIGISKNDGNPKFVLTDGIRYKVYRDEENRFPLSGGYGASKVYNVTDNEDLMLLSNWLYRTKNCKNYNKKFIANGLDLKGMRDSSYEYTITWEC